MSGEIVLAIIAAASSAFALAIRLQSGHINLRLHPIDMLIALCIGDSGDNSLKD